MNEFIKDVINGFGVIVEKASGALSLALLNVLAMSALLISPDPQEWYFSAFKYSAFALSFISLLFCILSIGGILKEASDKSLAKLIVLYFLLLPASVGIGVSVVLSLSPVLS